MTITLTEGTVVRPMAGNIGVEIHGIDVTTLDAEDVKNIRALWLERLVLVVRDQSHLDVDGLTRFASRFGDLYRHPMMPDDVSPVHAINIPAGGYWHSDVTFNEAPPMGTMLHARSVPPGGGDTIWANMYLAYETLSEPMRQFLAPLRAVHDFDHFYRYPRGNSLETDQFILDRKKQVPLPSHPVVRTHPETGRRALFVNESFTSHIEGLSTEESNAVLELLYRHSVKPEFTCRHRWSVGDICFWDNRCTMHYPIDDWGGSIDDPDGSKRKMNRVTMSGDRPV